MSKFFEDFTQKLDSANAAETKAILEASIAMLEAKQDDRCDLTAAVYTVAVDALEKRIIAYAKEERNGDAVLYKCPACGEVVDNSRHRFCEKCGQAIRFPRALQSDGE